MKSSAFDKASGQIEFNELGEPTFLPNPLPESIQLSSQTIYLLSEADRKLGQLNGAAEHLPNPGLIISPFIRTESVLSSRLEGTHAKLEDVFKAEVELTPKKSADLIEVANATEALTYCLNNLQTKLPPLAKEMHGILFNRVKTEGPRGEFRRTQNFIGPTNQIEDARYIPPMPKRLDELMGNLDAYYQSNMLSPPLLRVALIHYQFESIHPFMDGNGRLGRTLITHYLVKQGVMSQPVLFLSEYFNKHRDRYWDTLLEVNKTGNFEKWLQFFLLGVIKQSELTLQRVNRLVKLKEEYHDKLKNARVSARTYPILDELFKNPFTTIPYTAKQFNMSFPTAQRILEIQLNKLGIVEELTNQKRNRIFYAREILSIINPEKFGNDESSQNPNSGGQSS